MDRPAIRTTSVGRSDLWRHQTLMTSLKLVRKRRQKLHARDLRGLVAFCFWPLEVKIVNKSCFMTISKVQTVLTPISGPDKHTELLKIYFTPLVKKFKFSTSVAKSDLRFKVH